MSTTPNWRALYAAGLWHTGAPITHIAVALGGFAQPVSRQRVAQLLASVGVAARKDRRAEKATRGARIPAAFDFARAAGHITRAALTAAIMEASGCTRKQAQAAISARFGPRQHIPPPDVPDGWRWCGSGAHFVATLANGQHNVCQACHAARMRRMRGYKETT